jgi:hypothetical protein
VKLPHSWSRATPVFDDENLVSCAGLVPVMALAERAGLSGLISSRVAINATTVRSAGVNPCGQADLDHCGDGRGCGLHRRPGRGPLRRDAATVRRGVRMRDVGPVSAGVHPRPQLHLASVAWAHLVNLVHHSGLAWHRGAGGAVRRFRVGALGKNAHDVIGMLPSASGGGARRHNRGIDAANGP